MAFDPTKPAEHTPLDAAEVRENFNALKALIDAQAVQITALEQQVAALAAQMSTVPPGQPVLTLQYAGGTDVPMVVNAPRSNTVLVQRRYQGETEWPTVATLQIWGTENYTDTLPGTGVFEYRLVGVNNGGPGTPSETGTVSAV
jgi:hypothetical protein